MGVRYIPESSENSYTVEVSGWPATDGCFAYSIITSTENCLTPIDRQLPTRQSSQRGAVLSGLGKFHWPDLDLVPG